MLQASFFRPQPGSPIPCVDTFHGDRAFSEPETSAVRDFVMSKRHRLHAYLAFHSFGNKILYPWGYTNNPTNDVEELRGFAEVAKSAISTSFAQSRSFNWLFSEDQVARYDVAQVSHRENKPEKKPSQSSNTVRNSLRRIIFGDVDDTAAQTEAEYEYGQPQNIIYRVTGGSDDWARGGAGIKWVLLFELPGGVYGFMLPPRFIRPVRIKIIVGDCDIILFVGRLLYYVQCGCHGPTYQLKFKRKMRLKLPVLSFVSLPIIIIMKTILVVV